MLTSAAGSPLAFEVVISGPDPAGASRFFAVTGMDPAAGLRKTCEYHLPDTQLQGNRVNEYVTNG